MQRQRAALSSGRAGQAGSTPVVVVRTLAFLFLRRILGVVGGPTPNAKDVEIAVTSSPSYADR